MYVIKELLRPIKDYVSLVFFRRKFRIANQQNEVVPENIFPIASARFGRYTYGHVRFITWGSGNEQLTVGDFVSIGSNVTFMGGGNHKMDSFSTFPFNVKFFDQKVEALTKGPIIIKDDVWIGSNSLILSGITVGQGAVVAAGSVVTKDVPPYSIVGGNPARILKYRFEKEQVELLKQLDFSQLDQLWLVKNEKFLYECIESQINNPNFQEKMTRKSN